MKELIYDKVAGFQALISLTAYSFHVMYVFQSEPTLYICLNIKKLFARRSMSEIWRLSDCNWAQIHNHLGHKQILNHLAKLTK